MLSPNIAAEFALNIDVIVERFIAEFVRDCRRIAPPIYAELLSNLQEEVITTDEIYRRNSAPPLASAELDVNIVLSIINEFVMSSA